MKIALAQTNCEVGAVQSNCEKFSQFAAQASQLGAEIIIFPEMSDTGYLLSSLEQDAGTWPGYAYNAASVAAKDNQINLICGISERAGDTIFNSLACFNSAGELIGSYRKTHLFTPDPVNEDLFCRAGDKLALVEIAGLKWGLSICYDLRFPELYRALSIRGADILLNCAAWPAARSTHWDCLARARAIENQCFFVGVDRVGKDGKLKMNGASQVVSPTGEILAQAGTEHEELIVTEINRDLTTAFRSQIPTLSSRREDIY